GAPVAAGPRAEYVAAWQAILPSCLGLPPGMAMFDYHVDNLMLLAGREGIDACGLLDFQDAVPAPACFDLMSLIEDARRDVPASLAEALIDRFLRAFPDLDRRAFEEAWPVLAAQRHARIIGTFARLKMRDGKPAYLVHLPRVWRQLEAALRRPPMAPLRAWFDRHLPAAAPGLPASLTD